MDKNIAPFNENLEQNALDVLRLGIINLCGIYPEIHKEYLEIHAIGRADADRLKRQLKSLPGVEAALSINHDPDHPKDRIFKINKKKYLAHFHPNMLHASPKFVDSYGAGFHRKGHWDRIEELDRITERDWGVVHSPVYETDIVQLIPSSREPASRVAQIKEMAHQLRGDSRAANAEAHDWVHHVVASERKANTDNKQRDGKQKLKRTVLPTSWITKASIVDMENRINFSDKEKERLRNTLSLD